MALPSELGVHAVQRSLRSRRPTPVTADDLGFLLDLRPLSKQGILPEFVTKSQDTP
jgi:hypothetical protein